MQQHVQGFFLCLNLFFHFLLIIPTNKQTSYLQQHNILHFSLNSATKPTQRIMFRLSLNALSVFLFAGLFTLSASTADHATSKYNIQVYECDRNLERLATEDRQKKIQGVPVRICFAPGPTAEADGIGIARIDSWTWETTFKGGGSTEQQAIINGSDDGILSSIRCKEGGKLCVLDTMLTGKFYENAGTVFGAGEATFTSGAGTVPVQKDLFQVEFEFKFTHGPGGDEMTPEETQELLKLMSEQNAAAAASAAAGVGAASAEL
jgi:hypothetical protein